MMYLFSSNFNNGGCRSGGKIGGGQSGSEDHRWSKWLFLMVGAMIREMVNGRGVVVGSGDQWWILKV